MVKVRFAELFIKISFGVDNFFVFQYIIYSNYITKKELIIYFWDF